MPSDSPLRAHLLGLTVAFVVLLIFQVTVIFEFNFAEECCDWTLDFNVENLSSGNTVWGVLIIIIWFGLVTYYFGIWALLTLIFLLFSGLLEREYSFWHQLDISARTYIAGYLFGGILGTLYNDVKYLYIYIFRKSERKLMFAYDSDCMLNVIKSPYDDELPSAAGIPKNRWLYNFRKVSSKSYKTFTIAFVANPCYLKKDGQPAKKDPVVKNVYLFLRTVARAMESFHNDTVLGRPEIWSRVRIITIFDKEIGRGNNGATQAPYGFVSAPRSTIPPSPGVVSSATDTLAMDDMVTLTNSSSINTDIDVVLDDELQKNITQPALPKPISFNDIDVIFFLSAIPRFLRSTAQFSSDDLVKGKCLYALGATNIYTFDENGLGIPIDKLFERRAKYPGKVALGVLGAIQKTFVHEFAHAMSHACHGAIVDEYFDEGVITFTNAPPPSGTRLDMFTVNRLNKSEPRLDRVPKIFADYHIPMDQRCSTYNSDRDHPSAEDYWSGCYTERQAADIYCTMDRSYGRYQFDKLISDYMYDRLIHKI
jgi:hypothetical protein